MSHVGDLVKRGYTPFRHQSPNVPIQRRDVTYGVEANKRDLFNGQLPRPGSQGDLQCHFLWPAATPNVPLGPSLDQPGAAPSRNLASWANVFPAIVTQPAQAASGGPTPTITETVTPPTAGQNLIGLGGTLYGYYNTGTSGGTLQIGANSPSNFGYVGSVQPPVSNGGVFPGSMVTGQTTMANAVTTTLPASAAPTTQTITPTPQSGNLTGTIKGGQPAPPTAVPTMPQGPVACQPVVDETWSPDARYVQLQAQAQSGAVQGRRGVVVAATHERRSIPLFIPSNDLVAVNEPGSDPSKAALVFDWSKPANALDPIRFARLHSMMRVVRPDPSSAWAPFAAASDVSGSLAFQMTGAGDDGLAGYGLTYDLPFASAVAGTPNVGIATTGNRPPAGVGVVGLLGSQGSGPIMPGGGGCPHQVGTTRDGEAAYSNHISTNGYFRGNGGDGPVLFESPGPKATHGPVRLFGHVEWDPTLTHQHVTGQKQGKWVVRCEGYDYTPTTITETTTTTKTPPPWIDIDDPPDDDDEDDDWPNGKLINEWLKQTFTLPPPDETDDDGNVLAKAAAQAQKALNAILGRTGLPQPGGPTKGGFGWVTQAAAGALAALAGSIGSAVSAMPGASVLQPNLPKAPPVCSPFLGKPWRTATSSQLGHELIFTGPDLRCGQPDVRPVSEMNAPLQEQITSQPAGARVSQVPLRTSTGAPSLSQVPGSGVQFPGGISSAAVLWIGPADKDVKNEINGVPYNVMPSEVLTVAFDPSTQVGYGTFDNTKKDGSLSSLTPFLTAGEEGGTAIFGDGSDDVFTLDGTTLSGGPITGPVFNNYFANRDVNAVNLTLVAPYHLYMIAPNGGATAYDAYSLLVQGTLNIPSGCGVHWDGASGTAGAGGGAGGLPGIAAVGDPSITSGGAGGSGGAGSSGTGAGSNGTAGSSLASNAAGGKGGGLVSGSTGEGGAGDGSHLGGNGGAPGAVTAPTYPYRSLSIFLSGLASRGFQPVGGAGGGAGGGGGSASAGASGGRGGGGGAGAPVGCLGAQNIVNYGSISFNGGPGGAGASASGTGNAGGGGSGSGGGGGLGLVAYNSLTGTGAITAIGGSPGVGGAGVGTGGPGRAGNSGLGGIVIKFNNAA